MSRSTGQPSCEMQSGVAREIDGGLCEAVARAERSAGCRRRAGRPGIDARGLERWHPDEDRGATERQALDRELVGRRVPDGLERVVGAAVGEAAERLDGFGLVVAGDDAVRRAELARGLDLGCRAVDGDDPAAFASTAPMTIDSPTPPSPITATLAPAGTSAVLRTAPTPVDTQHPMSAATAGSTPSGSATAAASGTTVASAIVPIPQYERIGSPAVRGEDGRAVGHPMGERRGVRTGPRVAAATGATLTARHEPG